MISHIAPVPKLALPLAFYPCVLQIHICVEGFECVVGPSFPHPSFTPSLLGPIFTLLLSPHPGGLWWSILPTIHHYTWRFELKGRNLAMFTTKKKNSFQMWSIEMLFHSIVPLWLTSNSALHLASHNKTVLFSWTFDLGKQKYLWCTFKISILM